MTEQTTTCQRAALARPRDSVRLTVADQFDRDLAVEQVSMSAQSPQCLQGMKLTLTIVYLLRG